LAKEGRIILDLDDVVEKNHVSSQTRELCTLQFGNVELIVLFEPWMLSPDMKEMNALVPNEGINKKYVTLCLKYAYAQKLLISKKMWTLRQMKKNAN